MFSSLFRSSLHRSSLLYRTPRCPLLQSSPRPLRSPPRRTSTTTNAHDAAQQSPIVDFPPSPRKIPIVVWIVAGITAWGSFNGGNEQLQWDPKDYLRSAAAGSTWGSKRQQDGLSELNRAVLAWAAPFAAWDAWGKIVATGRIGKIVERGISSKDEQTRLLAYNLFESILFKTNGLMVIGEDRASFRKLIKSIVTQALHVQEEQSQAQDQHQHQAIATDSNNKRVRARRGSNLHNEISSVNNLDKIYSIRCLASICVELCEEKKRSKEHQETQTQMLNTLTRTLLSKVDQSNNQDGMQLLCNALMDRTKQLQGSNGWSAFNAHEELDRLIVCIAALSTQPKIAKRFSSILPDLCDICQAAVENDEDHVSQQQAGGSMQRWQVSSSSALGHIDPFVALRALRNIANATDHVDAKVEMFLSDGSSGLWSWLSELSHRGLFYADDLAGSALVGGGWGMFRSSLAMFQLNAAVRGGRFLAIGRTGVMSAIGACILTSMTHLSRETHRKTDTESDAMVLADFTLERVVNLMALGIVLVRVSPYSFFPAFLVTSVDDISGDSGGSSFSFSYQGDWPPTVGGGSRSNTGGKGGKGNKGDEDPPGSVEV